jgi:hypothetical protein
MPDLTDFLLARIADDEAVARSVIDDDDGVTFFPRKAHASHAIAWQPQRVLAECEAKRRIIAEHSPVDPCDAHAADYRTIPCDTLLFLASVYADHPDYRAEWAAVSA